jgi:hypothetical protein
MDTYRIVSEARGAPEMTDLGEPRISTPPVRGECFDIVFPNGYSGSVAYELAVGMRCRVIRTADDGSQRQCGGAVLAVGPVVRVSADGEGWQ